MSGSEIKSAVIGYGGAFNMGKLHAEQMNASGMRTVAACDLDPKRMEAAAKDLPGIKTFLSIDGLLADPDIDLCVVILPHNMHAPIAIQCAEAGKHVIVEKPMCLSVAEADAMVAASAKAGKMLSVFHNRRWDGDYQTIQGLIDEGMIGEVFHIEACMGGFHDLGSWWRSNKAISGGALFDWGAHIVDWIQLFLPGTIAGVDGYFHKLRWHSQTNEDHTELVIRFASGATAQVEISALAAAQKDRWRILGTHGSIVQNSDMLDVTVDHKGHLAKFKLRPKETRWQGYYENIAGHLMRGEELVVKPEEARRTIGIIEAAEESSKLKRTVVPAYT